MDDIPVTNADELTAALKRVRQAQERFAQYTQDQVDRIFFAAAAAANRARISLAHMAVRETGMGLPEDKVIKNHYAAEYIYNAYKDAKTCGIIEEDPSFGICRIAEPVGVIAALIPTTNPTSTAIFKTLLALKTRNGMILSPHPRAKECTVEAARIILKAAVAAGAPENIIAWIDCPSLSLSKQLMAHADLILATGGPGMVKAAYSSGRPAIGVGPGNVPAIVDTSADIRLAVSSVIHSKTFDNGMICASEQAVIVLDGVYDAVRAEFAARGCHFLTSEETALLRCVLLTDGSMNGKLVGQSAPYIAELAGFTVPETVKILIAEVESVQADEPFAHEKLCPVLAMYRAEDFTSALRMAGQLIAAGGGGHTASVYLDPVTQPEKLQEFSCQMRACRILVNTPSAQGGIGDLYNFRLAPSLTLGCGSWGGNSVSENVGVQHLLNIKTVAHRRENMLWFRTPEKVYFKKGCLPIALAELKRFKKAFLVTDTRLFQNGCTLPIEKELDAMGLQHYTFYHVQPDPTLACAGAGASEMRAFGPDVIIAVGGGSAIDAAKIMWVLYEHPEVEFRNMAMRFCDIRKRISSLPHMGEKAYFTAIPTTAGTGSEVTPFAVITDERTGIKYPLADYELMPDLAIVDADMMMHAPPGLTAASGIDAMVHALEAYVSVMASGFTDSLALQALKLIFDNLPEACARGSTAPKARENMATASCMAGMAFANAFLGVCHSMAHKLGAFHHIPHGIANALMIEEVLRFNAAQIPVRMGTFPQYDHPRTLGRYAEIADHLGIRTGTDEENLEALIVKIRELKASIGIPATIREWGVVETAFLKTLDEMSEQAFDDQCTGANPRYPLIREIRQMYSNAYYGTPV